VVARAEQGRALALVAGCTFLSMSVWFAATFVLPQLVAHWDLGTGASRAVTIMVQLGFVTGAVVSAGLGLPDAVRSPHLMACGALGAALTNALVLVAPNTATLLALRLLTGVCLALVYPPALKEVAGWFAAGRGTALGTMIAALTLGTALPHLVGAVVDLDWRLVLGVTSALAALGAGLALLQDRPAPLQSPPRRVTFRAAVRSVQRRDVALADLGYAGHMWELYAMWPLVGLLIASRPELDGRPTSVALLAFLAIGVGAAGCLLGGRISDRRGRPQAALLALVASGGTCLLLALLHARAPLWLMVALCLVWGFWVIADSAQFSAIVSERAEPALVGSALSLQLALGYLTTVVALLVVPGLAERSWTLALLAIAAGPVVGSVAIARLLR
jgi:MFS family permease